MALLLVRGAQTVELPDDDFPLEAGDRLLFAGRRSAEDNQVLVRRNANVAAYVLGERRAAEGWVWRKVEGMVVRSG